MSAQPGEPEVKQPPTKVESELKCAESGSTSLEGPVVASGESNGKSNGTEHSLDSVNGQSKALVGAGVKELVWYGAALPAPNPLRIRMFLAECGIEIGEIRLNLMAGEVWAPAHRIRNRHGQVPTLQITMLDGSIKYLSESVSMCRFVDSIYTPEADLFAVRSGNPLDSALVDSMIRQVEFRLGSALRGYWLHAHPMTAKVMPVQFKDYGQSNVTVLNKEYAWVNDELSKHSFIVGNRFTAADIILYSVLAFAKVAGLQLPSEYTHIQQYIQTIEARPSSKATGKVIEIPKADQAANGAK